MDYFRLYRVNICYLIDLGLSFLSESAIIIVGGANFENNI